MTTHMWYSLGYSVAVVAVSVALTCWNESTRRVLQNAEELDSGEMAYLVRRYRRRTQTNILLGLIGFAIFVGAFLSDKLTILVF